MTEWNVFWQAIAQIIVVVLVVCFLAVIVKSTIDQFKKKGK